MTYLLNFDWYRKYPIAITMIDTTTFTMMNPSGPCVVKMLDTMGLPSTTVPNTPIPLIVVIRSKYCENTKTLIMVNNLFINIILVPKVLNYLGKGIP